MNKVSVTPDQSIQAAYDSLPATGGVVVLEPGRYNVGAGIVMSTGKPALFRSQPGASIRVRSVDAGS